MNSIFADARRGAHATAEPGSGLHATDGQQPASAGLLGRRAPGVNPPVPGTSLPAHQRVLTD